MKADKSVPKSANQPALPLNQLLAEVSVSPENAERSKSVLVGALDRLGPDGASSNKGDASAAKQYLSAPLLSKERTFEKAIKNSPAESGLATAAVHRERLKDAAQIVSHAVDILESLKVKEASVLKQFLTELTSQENAVAGALASQMSQAQTVQREGVTSDLNDIAQANAKGLPPPPRQTPVHVNSMVTERVEYRMRPLPASSCGAPAMSFPRGVYYEKNNDKRSLFAIFDRMDTDEIRGWGSNEAKALERRGAPDGGAQARQVAASMRSDAAHAKDKETQLCLLNLANWLEGEIREIDATARKMRLMAANIHGAVREYFAYYQQAELAAISPRTNAARGDYVNDLERNIDGNGGFKEANARAKGEFSGVQATKAGASRFGVR